MVSELSALLTVTDGHQDELRAASQRFNERVSTAPQQAILKIGIRNMRHVIYDRGRRRQSLRKLRGDSLAGGAGIVSWCAGRSFQAVWRLVLVQFARWAKEDGEAR